ncbi:MULTISPECIES: sensor histidine kinase [unclassified Pseudodesulfovibrio]|uniref:sensor histidine kinase n=1 Tax=unclassified Pseudodesulfovibrio TaxID=2661612 RepID=UPI000FEBC576|nr:MULTISPECIES: sensor histidine kinase [unclassified Pseudodesulfovibrio]MCJ2165084.1 sensor histidine kinase [Pseudodesulfovibrio sp. S3-i]RWU03449.1 GHKL domain-containing protein [Pseudodesulfovibrio sp. S3]
MKKNAKSCETHKLLLTTMILMPAVPLLLSVAVGFFSFSDVTKRFAISSIRQVALDHKKMIDDFLWERRNDLESFLTMIPAESLTGAAVRDEVDAMQSVGRAVFQDMGIIGPQGRHVAYAGPYELTDKDYREAQWYLETLKNGYYVSDVFLGYRGVPHFVIAVARHVNGQAWVLRATIDPGVFGKIVNVVNIGDSGEAYIVNHDGWFQTRRRSGGALLERDTCVYPAQTDGLMTFTGEDRAVDYLFASALINGGKWRLLVRQKKEEAFHSTVMAAYAVALVLLVGGAIIVSLAFVISRRLLDTLREQAEAVYKLENQLLQAARLAELGEMAAGFAHEINNPLQIMKTDLALLDLNLKDVAEEKGDSTTIPEIMEIAEQFQIQIGRCAAITREILRFGRQDAPQLQPIDLTTYLPKVWAMVENKATVHGVQLSCEVDAGVPSIEADPGQLQQVMINLMNNAIHAVVERNGSHGGRIDVAAHGDERGNAVITVKDNGSGMSQDTLAKIFLPFFTTKAPGQGTGLGLSVCHSIIDSMGGELTVDSRKGEGATFTVVIPGKSS